MIHNNYRIVDVMDSNIIYLIRKKNKNKKTLKKDTFKF